MTVWHALLQSGSPTHLLLEALPLASEAENLSSSGESENGEDEEYDIEYYNDNSNDNNNDNEYNNDAGDDYCDNEGIWCDSCVIQLKLYTVFCCLITMEDEEGEEEEKGNYDDGDNDDDVLSHDSLTSSGETS